jgi:hypothetical protein
MRKIAISEKMNRTELDGMGQRTVLTKILKK